MEVDSENDASPVRVHIGFEDDKSYSSESSIYKDSDDDCPSINSSDDDANSNFMRHEVERIFRIPPKTYCKASKAVYSKNESETATALCPTCSSPLDRFYSGCTESCFAIRGREGENRLFFYLRQTFHRKPSSKCLR